MITVLPLIDMPGAIQATAAIVTILAGVIVYLFERLRNRNSRFDKCSSDLYSENETAQITSAILLRSFLKYRSYRADALNLISALLRVLPNGNLQKTLGDGLSFVTYADGQDFQGANLSKVSIKSSDRVRYEISGKKKYNVRSRFRKADFYRADISECSICSINFDKAVFMDTILTNTSFHNCSFRNANFKDADVSGTRFYACDLTGANFSTSRHRKDAMVITAEKEQATELDKFPLSLYLDKNGIVQKERQSVVIYPERDFTANVFLSHLGMMDSKQQLAYRNLKNWMEKTYHISFDEIRREDYRTSGQLKMVNDRLAQCCGVVIMAFSHLKVESGSIHDSQSEAITTIKNESFPSPWLQIETAFARAEGLPCLVIVQKGVNCNGIFDKALVQNEKGLYMVEYDDSIKDMDQKVIRKWINRFRQEVKDKVPANTAEEKKAAS